MPKLFIPDYYCRDLLEVDWNFFKAQGQQHVFLDIDNTLELQGAVVAGERTRQITEAIVAAGLSFSILSNAQAERAAKFCAPLNLPYLGQAAKPLTFRLKQHLRQLGIPKEKVILAGDQIFTDLCCARFMGCTAILVESLGGPEGFFLRLKRRLESLLRRLGQDPRQAPNVPKSCRDKANSIEYDK